MFNQTQKQREWWLPVVFRDGAQSGGIVPATSPRHPSDLTYEDDYSDGEFPYAVYPHPQITVQWELAAEWDTVRGRCKESFVWCGDPGEQIHP